MKYLRQIIVILISACLSLLSACSIRRKVVLYTVYPIGYLLKQIAGNTLTIQSIQTGDNLFSASLIPSYTSTLKHSQLLFYIHGLEPCLATHTNDIVNSQITTVDLAINNAIYDSGKVTIDDLGKETTTAYYNHPSLSSIDTNTKELHFWLDPIEMMSMGKEITEVLKKNYPQDAAYYQSNMDALSNKLIELDGKYQSFADKLQKEGKSLQFASLKDSYGVWGHTYGFQIYPVILSKYGVLPNQEQLLAIESSISNANIQYIVYDDDMRDEDEILLEALVSDLSLQKINIHDLSSLSNNGDQDYFSCMEENLRILQLISQ